MINLFGANDVLRLVTGSAATIDVTGAFVTDSDPIAHGSIRALISSATTTTLVAAPGAALKRDVYSLTIRNRHASLASTVTLQIFDGTNTYQLAALTLAAGETAIFDGISGWQYLNAQGMPRLSQSQGAAAPASSIWSESVLASDVANSNGVANTIADITGLSFPVLNGLRYRFRFSLDWTSAAGTTGARFSINGPTASRLAYKSQYALTATTETLNNLGAYDLPAAANAAPALVGGNLAVIEGFITPSADGNVIGRFASEVASSAITVKAGSMVEWKQVA